MDVTHLIGPALSLLVSLFVVMRNNATERGKNDQSNKQRDEKIAKLEATMEGLQDTKTRLSLVIETLTEVKRSLEALRADLATQFRDRDRDLTDLRTNLARLEASSERT